MFQGMALNVRFVPADKGLFRWVDWVDWVLKYIRSAIRLWAASQKKSSKEFLLLNWFVNKPESISIGATHSMR
jgi:hypothetical protein